VTTTDFPPRLELGAWRVRALREEDAAAWTAYLRDPAVTEHTSWPPVDLPLITSVVRRAIAAYAERSSCRCAVARAEDDRLIGSCGFSTWSDTHGMAELVYDLAAEHWGRGTMSAAVRALTGWAFASGIHRVQAVVLPSNLPSARLLERCGFQREGLLRGYRRVRGTPRDFWMYSLLAPEATT
jgi:RimJ/RimL family protein N-acetyltransferase